MSKQSEPAPLNWPDTEGPEPSPFREVETLARDPRKEGHAMSAEVPHLERTKSTPPTAQRPSDSRFCALTDMGNAERLVNHCVGEAKYCALLETWFIYDGIRFRSDTDGAICRKAKEMVRTIYNEAAQESTRAAQCQRDFARFELSEVQRKELKADTENALSNSKHLDKWAMTSENAQRLNSAVSLAKVEQSVLVAPEELDANPWLLNVKNGVVNLKTAEFLPHNRKYLLTKLAPVKYDASAKCPRWEQFLSEVFPGESADIIPFLQRAIGYSLTGSVREECFFILYGLGRNGKGVLTRVLGELLGDYAGCSVFSSLIERRRDGNSAQGDIADMNTKRFVVAQESREGAQLAEAVIKAITGGDIIKARHLYENLAEFPPTHKLWLASNHKPDIKGVDTGIWSRVKFIPFGVSFEGRENKNLKVELLEELPGILNWAIQGCFDWLARGDLGDAESVMSAKQDYRDECDQLQRFLDGECEQAEGFSVSGGKLYCAYKQWCNDGGDEALTGTAFGRRMPERGFYKTKGVRGVTYHSLRLRNKGED